MAYFTDAQTFYDLLVGTFDALMKDPAIKQKALDSKLTVHFVYRNPEGEFSVDCSGDEVVVYGGKPPKELTYDAVLAMDMDTAHAFWCGKLNLLGALSSGEIDAEGSMPRLLKLLPVIKPAYAIYCGTLEDKGLTDLIIEDED